MRFPNLFPRAAAAVDGGAATAGARARAVRHSKGAGISAELFGRSGIRRLNLTRDGRFAIHLTLTFTFLGTTERCSGWVGV